jgi:hypothetical protein
VVGHLGMSVLRDVTYVTLGARSFRDCRGTRSHFEVTYDGVVRLGHHEPGHASVYFRAAEPVPSLLFPLSDNSGLMQRFARENGLFRGVFFPNL